jgi:hypothetical protein
MHTTPDGEYDFAEPEIALILRDSVPGGSIQHLELNGVTWLEPYVMMRMAESLPNLRTLVLKQLSVWCGLCNTVDTPCFRNNPRRIIYDGGEGLPVCFLRRVIIILFP